MRINDWSSDVCSSDLLHNPVIPARGGIHLPIVASRCKVRRWIPASAGMTDGMEYPPARFIFRRDYRDMAGRLQRKQPRLGSDIDQIGRAACRERVGQIVEISVVDVLLKNKQRAEHKHHAI